MCHPCVFSHQPYVGINHDSRSATLRSKKIYLNSCGERAPLTPENITLLNVAFEFIFHPDDRDPNGYRKNLPLIKAVRIADYGLSLKQAKEFVVDGYSISGVFEAVTEYMNVMRREFQAAGLKSNLTPTSIKEKIVYA